MPRVDLDHWSAPGGGSGKVSETDPNTSAPEFCSDTIREPWEECDDGQLLGGYDGCEEGCKRGLTAATA